MENDYCKMKWWNLDNWIKQYKLLKRETYQTERYFFALLLETLTTYNTDVKAKWAVMHAIYKSVSRFVHSFFQFKSKQAKNN